MKRGAVFIGSTHHEAWCCVYWQYATSSVGLCLLAVRTMKRGAVSIGSTQHHLSSASEVLGLVSSLLNISLKCFYSSLSEGIWKQSGEVSPSEQRPASRTVYRPKSDVTTDIGSCDVTCVKLCKMNL